MIEGHELQRFGESRGVPKYWKIEVATSHERNKMADPKQKLPFEVKHRLLTDQINRKKEEKGEELT